MLKGGDPAEAPMGRAAMCLDSDSDEAEVALVPTPAPRKLRKDKKLHIIMFRGMELTDKARDKCRGLAVPLEGETLVAILIHLCEHMFAGEVPEPDPVKSARRQEVRSCREDEDAGRNLLLFPSARIR